MLDKRENIKNEIKELIDTFPKIDKILTAKGEGKKVLSLSDITALSYEYQRWYTKALAVVRQLMPDRLEEFEELYIKKRPVKELTVSSYTISDFLLGISVTRRRGIYEEDAFDNKVVFATKLYQQLAILQSAYSRVDSILSDITGVLRADLFDSEIQGAHELLKNNYLRAAGTVASVVLESHLSQVCKNHNISFPKKILHISDYNEALKQNVVYDTPTWRLIQRYNDIRILCCHAKDREPTKDEVKELIDGVEKAIKTIF
jgi:hypothetical protein